MCVEKRASFCRALSCTTAGRPRSGSVFRFEQQEPIARGMMRVSHRHSEAALIHTEISYVGRTS